MGHNGHRINLYGVIMILMAIDMQGDILTGGLSVLVHRDILTGGLSVLVQRHLFGILERGIEKSFINFSLLILHPLLTFRAIEPLLKFEISGDKKYKMTARGRFGDLFSTYPVPVLSASTAGDNRHQWRHDSNVLR